jgi:mannosyltransferase
MRDAAHPRTAIADVDVDRGAHRRLFDRIVGSTLTVDVAIVCSVAFVLGLVRLGTPSLWLDESFTAQGDPVQAFTNGYHWLYYSLEWPWRHLVGDSEWALRFPSVVGSMLACALLVVLARRFFERPVALAAGLLLATSPFFVKWSQQARGYTFLVAVGLLATLVLLRALERGTPGAWAGYGFALTLVVLWHPVGALLLVPSQVVLVAQRRERAFPHVLLAAVIVMVIGVPWAAQIAVRSTGEGVAMNWLKFPTVGVAARTFTDVSGVAGVGVLLALVGLWLLRRRSQSSIATWLGTWAFAPFVLALAVSLVRPIYLDRYLMIAAPAFALLGGVALMYLGTRWRAAAVAAVVVVTSVGLVRWYSTAGDGNWRGEDWRTAVSTVLAKRGNAAVVVAPWSASPAADYYGAKAVSASTADSVWVLVWSEDGRDLTGPQRAGVGLRGHRLVESIAFGKRLRAELWTRT